MSARTVFMPGDDVEWWHVPRGGYGYGYWVPAYVVRSPKTGNPEARVRIRAKKRDGTVGERSVYAKNLRHVARKDAA